MRQDDVLRKALAAAWVRLSTATPGGTVADVLGVVELPPGCEREGPMAQMPCLTCGVFSEGMRCPAHGSRKPDPRRGSGGARDRFRRDTLALTGGRCAVPGCATPFDRVQAHRLVSIANSGTNDARTNGQPLCHDHHLAADLAPSPHPVEPAVFF